jgi:TonB family protein
MNLNPRHLAVVSALLLAALPASAQFVAPAYVPMSYVEAQQPLFPRKAVDLGLARGEARIAIQIDENGRLTDYVAVAYSHPAFRDAAVEALKAWTFRPAQVHGNARSATAVLDFAFKAEGVVVDLTLDSAAEVIHYRLTPGSESYRACTLSDLDKIPTPTKIVKPAYTPEQAKESHIDHVTVDFYIDEDGRVRLPAVSRDVDEADEELCAAAVSAVEQWRFEPPVKHGSPVLVLAQQVFEFKAAR